MKRVICEEVEISLVSGCGKQSDTTSKSNVLDKKTAEDEGFRKNVPVIYQNTRPRFYCTCPHYKTELFLFDTCSDTCIRFLVSHTQI